MCEPKKATSKKTPLRSTTNIDRKLLIKNRLSKTSA